MSPETLAPVSVDEFWHIAHRLERAELVAGHVVEMTPSGARHGGIVVRLGGLLDAYVRKHGLGAVLADAGFILRHDPATVRGPDLAVVLKARVGERLPTRFFPGAPDLAVEVLSPDDRPAEVAAKVGNYLEAGGAAVWVVDPEAETVSVHTRGMTLKYGREEEVSGDPVLPGLRISGRDLLA